MTHTLKSKKSLGELFLLDSNQDTLEVFPIGEGRFSITPTSNFFLLNFWVKSEYEHVSPSGHTTLLSGPTLEVLTKLLIPEDYKEIIVPDKIAVETEWDSNYITGYYNGWHNLLLDAKLSIHKTTEGTFEIKFSGRPDEDNQQSSVSGNCVLQLSNDLKRYW